MTDVIIIGKGPAGLSAALYVRRANLTCEVIGKDSGALQRAEKIENYFGLPRPVSGAELLEAGLRQASALGTAIVEEEAFDLDWDDCFIVHATGGEHRAHAVILATGAARKAPSIAGISDFEGRGVSYCAVCDAFFYKQKTVAVLGGGDYALHELTELAPIAGEVVVLLHGEAATVTFPEGVRVIPERITGLTGEVSLDGVTFENSETLALSGLFVALGSAAAGDLARRLGAEVEGDRIVVDTQMRTAVSGLFAAGDCVGGLLQVATAVSDGAIAGMSAIHFVRGK